MTAPMNAYLNANPPFLLIQLIGHVWEVARIIQMQMVTSLSTWQIPLTERVC